jgi:hypothetical protein
MVTTSTSLNRNASSDSPVVASATTPSEQAAREARQQQRVEHFSELNRLVDPQSLEGSRIIQWFKTIGDRLLAADGTKLTHEVSYHLSDSKEPQAFVYMHEGKARIVISTGLFSLIKNEDQLAFIIAHELMHVRFKEEFAHDSGKIPTTKVEEYIADVKACGTWVINAGYAPHQAVAFFDALKELRDDKEMRVLRPLQAFTDVHGLNENRSQAISGLIAREIKEKGGVPVDITPLSGETKANLKTARHVSHFERLKQDPSYAHATPEQRYPRLLEEMKAITTITAVRIPECVAEFKELFTTLPVTSTVVEDIYGALKENRFREKTAILTEAYRATTRQGQKPILPTEVQAIAREIKTFIASKSEQQLLESGAKLAAFAREWTDGDPGITAAIQSSFDLERVLNQPPPFPWERQLELARTTAARGDTSMIEALWAIGVYDMRALDVTPDKLLASFDTLPQLTPCKHAAGYYIDSGGIWRRNPFAGGLEDPRLMPRISYASLIHAESKAREHKRNLALTVVAHQGAAQENLADIPPEIFARTISGILHQFGDEIGHPSKIDFLGSESDVDDTRDDATEDVATGDDSTADTSPEAPTQSLSGRLHAHYATAGIVARKFEQMENHADPSVRREAAAGIRAFYLNTDGPCFESLIGRFPDDRIGDDKEILHPLVRYAISCTALTAQERVDFLRGLEDRLSPALWNKAYFTGYELPTNRAKLRHLQAVAPYQESALRAGAALVAQEFKLAALKPSSFIEFISEHKSFFPALRQLDDDTRQAIHDRIEPLTTWEGSREQIIDTFWALEQAKLFPGPEFGVREMLRKIIIDEIQEIADPQARKELAERVLLSPSAESTRISEVGLPTLDGTESEDAGSNRQEMLNRSSARLSLKDPVVRSAVTALWTNAVRELIHKERPGLRNGCDDGSAEYISTAQPHLARIACHIRRRLPVQERRELLGALADHLELQETLAFFLRDSITEHSRATVADAHEYFRSAEAGFEFINQDPWRREAVVQFLSQPLTSDNLERFAHRADISRNRELTAMTDTVESILGRLEKQLSDTETGSRSIERITGEKMWIGALFWDASADQMQFIQTYRKGWRTADDLVESLEEAMPTAIPVDARENITQSFLKHDTFSTIQEAHVALESSRTQVKEALRAAIEDERGLFETALKDGFAALEKLPPSASQLELKAVRTSLLQRLADLPEYDFVGALEDRLTSASSLSQIQTVITRSINGLSKSFDRERSREEVRFDKETTKLLRTLEKNQEVQGKRQQERAVILKDFHDQLHSVLESFGDTLTEQRFPELHKAKNIPLEHLPAHLDGEAEDFIGSELEIARDTLINELIELEQKARSLNHKVETLSEMHGNLLRNIGDFKRAPAPVQSIMEEATRTLTFVESEYRENEPFGFTEEVLDEFNREYPRQREDSRLAVTPLEEQHARQFYELFWSQSAEVRSVALKLLLIPPEAEYQDRKSGKSAHFDKAFEFVAEQIFPVGMKYGTESKKILRIFLEETDPSLRGFMLAALMAASEKVAGAPEEYSAGKRLAMILSMLGPAEKKLGQAINSHPLTPEDLRSDTKSIKSMSDPLPRWELLERVAEAVPAAYRDAAIPRIGSTLGAASYYIAVDCNDSVLSILRPHARELARTGLDRMEAIAVRLSQDPQLTKVATPFIESIHQARTMIAVETDHEKGVVQQRNAWDRYDGLEIRVEEETFPFHTAAWKACGPEFRHQEKVDGEHFLDMWEVEGANDPFLRKAALAHVTAELLNILSGAPFDHDRHGSQSKISRGDRTHSIGLFDHGCMALEAPSAQEKEQLSTVLCDLVQGYLDGKTGLLERAHTITKERREQDGVAPAYLVSVERALLALNDFMRFDATGKSTLLQPSDLGGALAAVFRAGEVDPIFSSTIASRFAGKGASMVLKYLSPSQLCTKIADKIVEKAQGAPRIKIARTQPSQMPEPIVFDRPRMAA